MSEHSRLRWLCRRGMKELDLVMSRYLEQCYRGASDLQRKQFKVLLDMPDPELYDLLLGRSSVAPDTELAQFIQLLRDMPGKIDRES